MYAGTSALQQYRQEEEINLEFLSEGGDIHDGPYCLVVLPHSSAFALV